MLPGCDWMNVRGKRISVIGAARSGLAAAQLLQQEGASVFVSDLQPIEKLASAVQELERLQVPYEFGEHSERVFDAELFVISPGVPSSAPVVAGARTRDIPIFGELEAASWFCRAPIVAVTGSNGKTTTTALIGRILTDARRNHVGCR